MDYINCKPNEFDIYKRVGKVDVKVDRNTAKRIRNSSSTGALVCGMQRADVMRFDYVNSVTIRCTRRPV